MYKIGQQVVAIKNHSQLKFKKGDVFTIIGKHQCMCGLLKLNFAELGLPGASMCNSCRFVSVKGGFLARSFAPIDSIQVSESFSDSLIKELEEELNVEELITK